MLDPNTVAKILGGKRNGQWGVICPGPGHSRHDVSLSIVIDPNASDGFAVLSSFAHDDVLLCKDYVRAKLGLSPWRPGQNARPARTIYKPKQQSDGDRSEIARAIWNRRRTTAPELINYLRSRAHTGLIPATVGYLPANGTYDHAMIAAVGFAHEVEPGVLAIFDDAVRAIHLTKLNADGSDRIRISGAKIMVGIVKGAPIVIAPPNDLLGLAITEGIEDALSVHEATGLGAWAAGSASFMPELADAVPSFIDSVSIIAHNDPSGLKGARELRDSLTARKIHATIKVLEAPA